MFIDCCNREPSQLKVVNGFLISSNLSLSGFIALKFQLDTESALAIAEAVKDADFTPQQLLLLILGGIALWNAKGLYALYVTKYEIKRKYDLHDKKVDTETKRLEEKKAARATKSKSRRKQ